MNEPFFPLPLPSPPEAGYGPLLARALRRLTASLARRGRRCARGRRWARGGLAAPARPSRDSRLATGGTAAAEPRARLRLPIPPPPAC